MYVRLSTFLLTCIFSVSSFADVIYSEDFSTDPGITSLAPAYTNWDSIDENYRLETYRNNNEKYWSYKEIPSVQASDLDTVSVDIYYESLNALTYPAFRFFGAEPTESSDPANPFGAGFSQYNCCGDPNRFVVYGGVGGTREISTNHITSGVWYNVLMEFSSDLTFDALVTERDSGNVLLSAQDLTYVDREYNYFGMGYYTSVSPNVGPTTLRVDNIEITSVPAPATGILIALALLGTISRRRVMAGNR